MAAAAASTSSLGSSSSAASPNADLANCILYVSVSAAGERAGLDDALCADATDVSAAVAMKTESAVFMTIPSAVEVGPVIA